MPSAGSDTVSNAHDGLQKVRSNSSVPSGLRTSAYALLNVPSVSANAARWPAVPAKDQVAACPGAVVVSLTGPPPAVIVPVTSPSLTCALMEPTAVLVGSRTRV